MATIRAARLADLQAVVAVMRAADEASLGEPDTTEADILNGWQESGFDVERDAVVAVDEGRLVGYAEVYDRGQGVVDLDVVTPPGVADDIAAALLDEALGRARGRFRKGTVLSTWLPVGDPKLQTYADAGFTQRRTFLRMRLDLDNRPRQASPPQGLRIVPFRPGADEATVHRVLVDAFSDHVRPLTPQLDRFVEQHVHHPDFDAELWGVAWEGEHAVGAITVFDHGDLGFVRHVGVRADRRGRGIASALITWAADVLHGRGQTRVDLGVDLDDDVKAAALYERLGFHTVQRLRLVERSL
ncbi:MAG TPA: GNAT family N-acetyltransferase [Egibacteraceae bacterium]|nr:GNAT family N-acetyltransferase [Egibacteraceae bacterium]